MENENRNSNRLSEASSPHAKNQHQRSSTASTNTAIHIRDASNGNVGSVQHARQAEGNRDRFATSETAPTSIDDEIPDFSSPARGFHVPSGSRYVELHVNILVNNATTFTLQQPSCQSRLTGNACAVRCIARLDT